MFKVFKYILVLVILLLFRVPFVSAQSNFNPAAVIVEHNSGICWGVPICGGMGFVVDNNLVMTAAHINWDAEVNSVVNIYFQPFTHDISRLPGMVVVIDRSRDIMLIRVNTRYIKPYKLADNVKIGEHVYWNIPFDGDLTKFRRVSGKVFRKEDNVKLDRPKNYYIHEQVTSPVGSELTVLVGHANLAGSSGGAATNDNGDVAGLVVTYRDAGNSMRMISIDGIRRFLKEYKNKSKLQVVGK